MNERITGKQKLSYFAVNFGNIPLMTLMNTYLAAYFVKVVGLPEAAVATMLLVARIFDGVTDPFTGFLIDRQKESKFGKYRRTLIWGTIICATNYALLWYGPAFAPDTLKLTVAYLTFLPFGITFDIMDISLNSMLPRMTSDLSERNTLSSIKGFAYIAGAGILGIGIPFLLGGMEESRTAYFIVIAIALAIVVGMSIGGALGVREKPVAEAETKYPIKVLFKVITVNPVFVTFLCALLFGIGFSGTGATNIFYAEHILGNEDAAGIMYIFMGIGMIPVLIFGNKLVLRFGKKTVFGCGIIILGLGSLLRLISMDTAWVVYGATMFGGLGAACSMALMYSVQADNTDYVDYKMGIRTEGAVASMSSMMTKVSSGIGQAGSVCNTGGNTFPDFL